MPSIQHLLLKQLLTAAAAPLARRKPSVGAMRLAMEAGSLLNFMPWKVNLESFRLDNRLEAEWLRPRAAHPTRAMLYLHGGGYVLGSLNTHRSLVGSLAQRCGLNVLTINYRKAPDHPFPAALDDARRAYRWLRRHGYQPHDIVVAGDSAGGGLALALLLALRDAGEPLPAAGIGLSPWTDLNLPVSALRRVAREEGLLLEALQMRTWGPLYAHKTALSHPLLSPLQADLHGLPPLLIQVSTAEVLYDDALRFADKARAAGVAVTLQPFEGLVHWWHLFWRIVPEARQALDQVSAFLEKRWTQVDAEQQQRKASALPQPRRRLAA
ncbi:alpha/beta hydrolase [Hymenobacter properus]|uniref:Alpha/beta hydrolase n=1 Tax=Hymenobacter properus TaxID=2791026 RepID=A0A931BPG9_9BACT|nr:alpha/beta hydrolase [Hymenobacter properus]MBF9144093.1 alpha/beta hydrolase [Hymenobacter properus]MBR7722909.1 alpha/beta hydrolase [Microvirga sp. SRT04]